MHTCILTARLDKKSQTFFDDRRKLYFPAERNFLNAHLTLFHKLPDDPEVLLQLENVVRYSFIARVYGLKSIGNGVAYFIESKELQLLHRQLQQQCQSILIAQDRQTLRPHITIQNKVSVEKVKSLLTTLEPTFEPLNINIEGLDLWHYLDGPWSHYRYFPFQPSNPMLDKA
ncbi:2'-5' RNA ligase family protein [Pedobacter sp. BMA]|uniref:2'-5' RNA ligase family protein n=1 Tax=Pedobacter sp. BMA TaxID=1663685 RepID=UPI00064A5F78|nr:2'-5' RNA ligase family protein [Pedobacter sp. BMA]KLT64282.1 hypothetical protein AB669_17105 [Pedobacter sp. BMA]